jgi:hypothetical protein
MLYYPDDVTAIAPVQARTPNSVRFIFKPIQCIYIAQGFSAYLLFNGSYLMNHFPPFS